MPNDNGDLPPNGLFPKKRAAFRSLRGSELHDLAQFYNLNTAGTDEVVLDRLCAHVCVPARSWDHLSSDLSDMRIGRTIQDIRHRNSLAHTTDSEIWPTPNRSGSYPSDDLFPSGTTLRDVNTFDEARILALLEHYGLMESAEHDCGAPETRLLRTLLQELCVGSLEHPCRYG
eukprot:TRINITY_DN4788_c0_g2_i2.p1 TRINITY_DN4788_c0_g2~~TRINITY_DN4788_c0_g2_i2.p1  ORF type:complete len:173 (+),score=14.55 TRINITY_DN4788_c0_g2_i2:203-721(+)